jgi:hypothetical protein
LLISCVNCILLLKVEGVDILQKEKKKEDFRLFSVLCTPVTS